jgi:peptidoglycan biosynthesis protein MviN/MurJ (putative lipid II flippase)
MRTSIFCLVINLVLVVSLVWHFKQGGLGLANSITSALNMALLFYALRRKLGRLGMDELRTTLWPMLGAALVAGLAAWMAWRWWEMTWGHGSLGRRLGAAFIPLTLATGIYFGLTMGAGVRYAKDLVALATVWWRR